MLSWRQVLLEDVGAFFRGKSVVPGDAYVLSCLVLWFSQEGHREIGADPGSYGRETDVDPVFCVADDGEGREQIPDTAPRCCWYAATRRYGCVEHDVYGVSRGGGKRHT